MMKSLKALFRPVILNSLWTRSWKPYIGFCLQLLPCWPSASLNSLSFCQLWSHGRIIGPSWLKWAVHLRGPLDWWTAPLAVLPPSPKEILPPPRSKADAKCP